MGLKKEIITKNMIINEVVKKYPSTLKVLNKFKVDSCCGGGQSIEKTAAQDKVNLEELLSALNEVASQ